MVPLYPFKLQIFHENPGKHKNLKYPEGKRQKFRPSSYDNHPSKRYHLSEKGADLSLFNIIYDDDYL